MRVTKLNKVLTKGLKCFMSLVDTKGGKAKGEVNFEEPFVVSRESLRPGELKIH